jgi:hypothetical protein
MTTTTTIPRKDVADIPTTMFVRVQDPSQPSSLDALCHEMTPLLVYAEHGRDWVRWSMPREVARKYGLGEMRCACCADDEESTPAETVDAYHVDTAWSEVGPFLTTHGYRRAVVGA